jgi:AcrR family transcriptional regulator
MSATDLESLPLRERKKALSRATILAAAERLFAERGYDDVTVAEIADASNVSVKTLFVYFRSKEDLAFGDTSLIDNVIAALQSRPADASPAVTVATSLIAALEADRTALDLEAGRPGYGESSALRSGLLRLWSGYEDRVTAVLAAEDDGPATPEHRMLAIQLVGICRLASTPEVRAGLKGASARQASVLLEGWLRDAAAAVDGFYD